jgi:hypothetical protein
MAAVDRFVNTNALGGGDGTTNGTGAGGTNAFASLNSWIANVSGLATDNYNVKCQGGQDTLAADINLAGITISGAGSIVIEAHPTEADGRYYGADAISTSNYYLNKSGGGYAVRPNEINITLRALQIIYTGGGGFESAVSLNSAIETGFTMEYCSVRAVSARSCVGFNSSNGSFAAGATASYRYNLLNGGSVAVVDFVGPLHGNWTRNFYNNTVYSSGSIKCLQLTATGGSGTQTFNCKNNAFSNSTAPLSLPASGAVLTVNTDKNGTDAGTSGTTNEITLGSAAATFTSPGTSNGSQFTLLASIDGVNLSLASDKRGQAPANPPDIGAYEFVAGGGSTTLAPAGFVNTNAFGSPTITVGAVTLSAAGLDDADAFGTPIVTVGSVTLSATGLDDADAFGTPVITRGAVSLQTTGLDDADAFGSPIVSTGALSLRPTGHDDADAFGASTITPGPVTLVVAGVAQAQAFGAAIVTTGALTLAPPSVANDNAFGAPIISLGAVTLAPVSLVSNQLFGTPLITPGAVTIAPLGFVSVQSFGFVTVTHVAAVTGAELVIGHRAATDLLAGHRAATALLIGHRLAS